MKAQDKRELANLEKADCLTGTMMGGIALKSPHFVGDYGDYGDYGARQIIVVGVSSFRSCDD